jgi:outer membrane protein insertion porin family
MKANRNILFLFFCFTMAACSTTRNIPEGDALYRGATVTLNADDLTIRQKKVLRADLQKMTTPKPNSRLLGIPVKLMIWNMFGKKKENSFFGKLRSRYGEPPVLASQLQLDANIKLLTNHLENKGFFKANVTADTTVRRKKLRAHYTANAGSQYKIGTVTYPTDSSLLSRTLAEAGIKSLLKPGQPYDLDLIKGERARLDEYLKERGFYYFAPDFLLLQADSSTGNKTVNMRMTVKPEVPQQAREAYYINDVFIYSDYSLNTAEVDTVKAHAKFYKGYYVVDPKQKYHPKLFEQSMQFNPGEVYNRVDHNRSLNRLMNLNVFKFVKNRFERAAVDSPKLDVYYYMTPLPKQSVRGQIGASTRSNNLNGSEFTLGYHHRNAFHAGEQLDVKIFAGSDVQFSGAFRGYNTYRAGGEIGLSFPRFLVPFFNLNTRSAFLPRTNIRAGYELLNRHKLYSLNSFNGGVGYIWRESLQKSHEFYPISITYALPANVTATFRKDLAQYPTMRHIIDTQFILGSTYQFTLNQQAGGIQKVNSYYFNGLADFSGNLAGLLVSNSGVNNQKRLFNAPFSQYMKYEADGRYYRKLGLGSSWANRIVVGYGVPYGNSRQLPYVKQFFTGGNNSIRAFRSRTVGPGTYKAPVTPGGYIPDQTGDIKLELNTEFRPQISGPLYGAIFIDAGNIWLKNEDPEKPGAKFSKNFLKELAVGAGVGIRLDIQVFVIRFDVAVPVRKPWLLGQQWTLNQFNLGNTDWRRENIVYNLAIGYPF